MNSAEKNGVTIVTATMRPPYIDNVFRNYARQKWKPKELIIVLNKSGMRISRYRKFAARYPNVRVFRLPERNSLGQCLNFAAKQAKYPYIAKFDDDDYYGPAYIPEAMSRFSRQKADLVGKHSFFFYFPHLKVLALRVRAFHPYSGRNRIAGATIMFHKRVMRKVQFSRVRQGSDVKFVEACLREGFKLSGTSPYHFAAIRRANRLSHTWKVSERELLAGKSMRLIKTEHFEKYVNRQVLL
ncbi:glycosyltransferase family 2 protein [Paenibacillus thermoaerophilus]|jgi:glycosyltransferase involved in cell wall biosynthesis|uniref:Glycosyltransferase family 2 protein n=1 Tax=Paenibacillus thermoaerophilus TaxID=1215385 RepID=A0ABW2V4G8_9BACL|nr:glycosyltransferase [Paenibacillus thermoaerophilus]TMV18835.1 glycosyltransferase family 2 protein [Paenibacillus thermoaerophilus]